jgi:hypothetical protein
VSFVSYGQKLVPVIRTDAFGKEYIVYKEIKEEKIRDKKTYDKKFSNWNDDDYKFTIGTIGGIGNNFYKEFGGGVSYSYGVYVEYEKIGVEIIGGAGLSNQDPTSYINGYSSNYVAGYGMNGIGVYYKFPIQSNKGSYYLGVGSQRMDEIATNDPKWVKSPYGIVGIKGYYFNNCEIKLEANLGIMTTLNFGFGVRF